ncbi:MAG: glycosyltransferase family 2 protein [Methylophaga sp.]
MKEIISVTVVIPCYDCASTLGRALESVLQQTVLPEQIILIDDASNDATREVMREFQNRYGSAWLKIVHQKQNYGPAHARNEGIRQSESDYIAFLDADDSWYPEKLEVQFRWMQCHPDVVLTGHKIMRNSSNQLKERVKEPVQVTKISRAQALFSNPFSTPTVMMKSNLPYRFESGQHHAEDYLLWLTVCLNNEQVYRLEVTLASIHKAAYGQSGLSGNLVVMQKGELMTYRKIYESKAINVFQYYGLVLFSLLKFVRRVMLLRLIRKPS